MKSSSSVERYYWQRIISCSIVLSDRVAMVRIDQSHFGRSPYYQSWWRDTSMSCSIRGIWVVNRYQRIWSMAMPCRYFVQSFYSSVHLNSIEVRGTLVMISNFHVHSRGPLQRDRGRSQVAISRIISMIGDTHIPWTLARSHLRVTSITAWVICYLYSL